MTETLFWIIIAVVNVPAVASVVLAFRKRYKPAFLATLATCVTFVASTAVAVAAGFGPAAVGACAAASAFWAVFSKLDYREWKRREARTS